ncbi:MAG: hypothetical protein HOJ15_03260 [Candidatus Jacksonbacteria bacterium]|jgi:hypothetical protein|nr:hypothetical protein [Candidatus Jacksonbacteria bacterium]MBT6301417.1 hypothetical protein [Candidatus Jacksonbacteria bacterium]MBT6756798.1 hypothetical protein [Candidatus Jacksonbacteria bacterium]MBT6954721.1 hypothetical protein [Candidatus Jacksonbacteria bacterium]MBT7008229.1 hypothetical protein [Candidatus Jacksonbacteria bacterium]
MQEEITKIKERNTQVEFDKAWETSWTRKLVIAFMTYVIALVWLIIIGESVAWLKAVVPTGGYLLSTLSLVWIKKWWITNKN